MAPSDVVSVQVYLTDASRFQQMNAVYTGYFKDPRPDANYRGGRQARGPWQHRDYRHRQKVVVGGARRFADAELNRWPLTCTTGRGEMLRGLAPFTRGASHVS